jgi:three-Cys-motif partner protein
VSDYRERFFEGVKDHSQIKLRAFDRYLVPWATKVGSRQGAERLWVVDGFAGTGQYDSGELGSAGLALEKARALQAAEGNAHRRVAVFFVEQNRENHRRLQRLRSQYREIEGFVERGNFWEKTELIASIVDDEPVFLFVDPFGLGDLKFEALVTLCRRLPTVDLMVNLASPAARRLAPGQPQLIDEAVGGPGWDIETVGDVFVERLSKACRFLEPARLPVLGAIGDLKYELIMAARNRAAYDLWNDEIADRDRTLLDTGSPADIDLRVEEAKVVLRELARPLASFSRRSLLTDARTRRCGDAHTRMYNRAVGSFVASGEWTRAPGPVDTAPMRWARR